MVSGANANPRWDLGTSLFPAAEAFATLLSQLKRFPGGLCLLLDASLNISTSHFTSTPSAFEDSYFTVTRYTNYLLTTYLLTLKTRERKMRDWKTRHQNTEVEYAGLENARPGKVSNTANFLKYRMHIFHSSRVAKTALTTTQVELS